MDKIRQFLHSKETNAVIRRYAILIMVFNIVLTLIAIIFMKNDNEPVEATPTTTIIETTTVQESTTEEETTIVETTVEPTTEETTIIVETTVEPTTKKETTTAKPTKPATTITTETVKSSDYSISEDDIRLIARMTMAEAEGESEYGKRLVIDTILNRVDSSKFPNTVSGVIYQKGQFSPVTNGRLDRCYVREDICDLVLEELESRTNSEVLYFNMGGYPSWATPLFHEGCHYFSK